MLYSCDGSGLVKTPEFDVRSHPCGDIECIKDAIGTIRNWEQRVVNDVLRKEGLSNGLRDVSARLFEESLAVNIFQA